ncbi:MAG: D-amino acid dehydrogenase [Betaproteobacteria bacterium]|nr:MAG: D-amino acid dehydrogenase [Betaproteobacteria bacterium]
MRIIVLGAGVAGVTAAWFLREAGHDVLVLERQAAAGMETSFANGGQISVSHAEPWANPGAIRKILKWLGRDDAPLLFRLRADPQQWLWGMQFLRECLPGRNRRNIVQLVRLGLYSRATLQALRRQTGIRYHQLERGILHLYTEPRDFEAAVRTAELMRDLGVDRAPKTTAECVAIEPALASARHRIAGGTYAASDESGDAHVFTQQLAALCEKRGVRFEYGRPIARIATAGDRVAGVETGGQPVRGDAYVVALGSYSPLLLRPLGVRLPIYPAKGYSVTLPVKDAAAAWTVSLSDESHKLVFSRLGERLRIAGTAELTGYDTTINEVRCRAILKRTLELFPQAGDAARAEFWAGLRPATPSNIPCIGRTRYTNLFLDTGHGTLGWTHACGSGRALADLVSGRKPEVDFAFL